MFQIIHSSSKRNMWTQRNSMWVFRHSMAKQTCKTQPKNWRACTVPEALQLTWLISSRPTLCVGRGGVVGTATPHGHDGPRIETRWRAKIAAPVQTGPGSNLASYKTGTGLCLGVEQVERGVNHPPPSSVEVKGRVELHLYLPSLPSWYVTG